MKTLTRWMSLGLMLSAGGAASAASPCPSPVPCGVATSSSGGVVVRDSYRRGYASSATPAGPVVTVAPAWGYVPVRADYYRPAPHGAEMQLAYARARQRIRGW